MLHDGVDALGIENDELFAQPQPVFMVHVLAGGCLAQLVHGLPHQLPGLRAVAFRCRDLGQPRGPHGFVPGSVGGALGVRRLQGVAGLDAATPHAVVLAALRLAGQVLPRAVGLLIQRRLSQQSGHAVEGLMQPCGLFGQGAQGLGAGKAGVHLCIVALGGRQLFHHRCGMGIDDLQGAGRLTGLHPQAMHAVQYVQRAGLQRLPAQHLAQGLHAPRMRG